ncbi:MAG: hypothetical protein DBX59_06835 [Bacillota bacterium]|nr:MAG: hypothetical protein DBX59_06835 [Bacillota bacterium]
MAKKKSNNVQSLAVAGACLLFGVLAFCLAGFLAAVAFGEGEHAYTATGFAAAFGWKQKIIGDNAVTWSNFNFMITLALFLPLIGGVLGALKGKLFSFIALAAFVAGAVLMFLCPTFLESSLTDAGKLGVGIAGIAGIKPALAVGSILGGVFSVLGALVTAYKTFFMKK